MCMIQNVRGAKGYCIHLLSFCNKVPQIGWFRTMEICCLIAVEIRNARSRYLQGLYLLRSARKKLFHAPLLASDGLLRITSTSAFFFT